MIQERLARLSAWAEGREMPPETLEIGFTAECNQSCLFCWRQNPQRPVVRESLSAARWKALIDEAASIGVRTLRVIGEGEPLLRPDAPEILEHAKRRGLRCFLCTNGTRLTRGLVDRLVELGWDWLNVSLEGPDETLHDSLTRTPGSFAKLREMLLALAERKRRSGSEKPGVNAGVTLLRTNFRSMPAMPAIARELGLFGIYLEPVTANSPESARLKLTEEEAAEWMGIRERLREAARLHGIWTNVDEVDAQRILLTNRVHADRALGLAPQPISFAETLCFHPFWFLSIRSNGQVGSCGTFTDFHTESLREGSLTEAWHGPWFRSLRDRMRRGEPLPQCTSCNTGFIQDTLDLRNGLRARLLEKPNAASGVTAAPTEEPSVHVF